ncbi:hypothetical protein RND71_040733 [Anisodus tanguticus]|uniref:Pectate lyase N-terminal domain-containing protein n=1 Tax=Anisodus tanguticus TaxID=243964 RepID=A0AAE1QTY7_9SOLA|nr:hypothetical protein RND71_040733 [Anisodus tanguticus]
MASDQEGSTETYIPVKILLQVQLIPYDPNVLDASILWTESRDVGDGYRAVRMVNNINLNMDAWNADKSKGGVRDGTIVALWEWWKGDNRNQHWKIVPYSSLVPNLHARIAEFDEYLEKQAKEDLNSSLAAYNQNPEEVTDTFNKEVGE